VRKKYWTLKYLENNVFRKLFQIKVIGFEKIYLMTLFDFKLPRSGQGHLEFFKSSFLLHIFVADLESFSKQYSKIPFG